MIGLVGLVGLVGLDGLDGLKYRGQIWQSDITIKTRITRLHGLKVPILHDILRTSLKRLPWKRLNGSHGISVAQGLPGIWLEAVHAYWQVSEDVR